MNSADSKWKEDTSTNISLSLSDMSLWLDTGWTNQPSLKNSSKGCPTPLPKPASKWTLRTPGKSGKNQHANAKTYIYAGDRSSVSVTTKKTSLHLKRKT